MRLNFFFLGGDSLASVDNFNKAIFYFKNDEKIKSILLENIRKPLGLRCFKEE